MHKTLYKLQTLEDSRKLAQSLAKDLSPGDVVTFQGNLGSGKTFLSREIIRYYCGADTVVASPTFNLLQIYKAKEFDIYITMIYIAWVLRRNYLSSGLMRFWIRMCAL